jgi:hypothetical protein
MQALERLSALEARTARGIELKYFGGLSYDEIVQADAISDAGSLE